MNQSIREYKSKDSSALLRLLFLALEQALMIYLEV